MKSLIIGFDTEDNGQNQFLCSAFYDITRNRSFIFTDREKARQFLFCKRNMKTIFFAHNLLYDLCNLDYPENTARLVFNKSKLCGATHGKNIFVDTHNFYPTTLEEIGKTFRHEKLKFDFSKTRGKQLHEIDLDTLTELKRYCLNDAKICAIVGKHLAEMSEKYRIKFRNFSIAGLSHKIFRKNFLTEKLIPRNEEINDFERLAYYGGRTEVFRYGKRKDIVYEDINSSYPHAMTKRIPNPMKYIVIKNAKWKDIENDMGITLAKINSPYENIPLLPFRTEEKKLIFPVGKWLGAYTHAELKLAGELGYKIEPIVSAIYPDEFSDLKKFVNHFYTLKNSSEGIEKAFYKVVLNSLYGKFAEIRYEIVRRKIEHIKPEEIQGKFFSINELGWVSYIGKRLPSPSHCFPVISAYISSYARIQLFEERLNYLDEPYYCDSDSCISSEETNYNAGSGLGQWKCERYKEFEAFAPKCYVLDGKRKSKGIPKSAIEISPNVYRMERVVKLAEGIRRKITPNSWLTIEKTLTLRDTKRKKNPDGTTEPLKIVSYTQPEINIKEGYYAIE